MGSEHTGPSAPDAGPRGKPLVAVAALWLLRAVLLGAAVACFVVPDFEPGQLTLAWSFYGLGVFVLGGLLMTFHGSGLYVVFFGAWATVTAFGLFSLLNPDLAVEYDGLYQNTARDGEVSRGTVFFGGVVSLAVANGLVLCGAVAWLFARLGWDVRPWRRSGGRRSRRGRQEDSLFPPES